MAHDIVLWSLSFEIAAGCLRLNTRLHLPNFTSLGADAQDATGCIGRDCYRAKLSLIRRTR